MPDISLMGAVYPDVPAVTLPVDGGGTARFTDTSPTTATDADVASGKVYFKSDGSQSTGTASGGSAVIQSLSVSQNGTYTAPTGVDGYSPVVVNVSGGGGVEPSEVNFIDYDGTVLHSYTVAQFQQLSAMPSNPSHTGLTAQGWNWSLADAKAQLTAMPDAGLTIGQMYVTDDGKTRIYVHFDEGRSSPYLGICPNGTVTIDWGDGSATETLTGTSLTTLKSKKHVYQPGDYVIELSVSGTDAFAVMGGTNGATLLTSSGSAGINARVYLNSIRKIEIGNGFSFGNYTFYYCYSLKSITIPKNCVVTLPLQSFYYCYALKSITIPQGTTTIKSNSFYYCTSLTSIALPNGITSIESSAFYYCYTIPRIIFPNTVSGAPGASFVYGCYSLVELSIPNLVTTINSGIARNDYVLTSLTIGSGVTSIAGTAFNSCYALATIRFLRASAPACTNSNAWTGIQTDCLMLIPYAGLASYLSASNYPAKASYTYLGYATYASSATLPTKDSTEAYNVTWYATKDDAKAGTNAISTGNGSEIYCTYAAV